MFIISELGIIIKMLISLIGYLIFMTVGWLDTFIFNRVFEGEFISEAVSIAILFSLYFLLSGFQ